ncbi:MAG: hypothetical protein ACXAC5_13265 [Promethearchaeota archaeon]|jgi:hypothetical protein
MHSKTISLISFAKAMFDKKREFFSLVKDFEKDFGQVNDEMLGILAQTAFFCYFNNQYKENLLNTCKAIGSGQPNRLYLHRMISPERWDELHDYIIGLQLWRGVSLSLPRITSKKWDLISNWLGMKTEIKEAFVDLLLFQLINDALSIRFFIFQEDNTPPEEYQNYSNWYINLDGTEFEVNGDVWQRFKTKSRRAIKNLSTNQNDLKELEEIITRETSPWCAFRYNRFYDIRISSIGILKSRGKVPPDDGTRQKNYRFFDEIRNYLQIKWPNNEKVQDPYLLQIGKVLGVPTLMKKRLIEILLEKPVNEREWEWIYERSMEIQ